MVWKENFNQKKNFDSKVWSKIIFALKCLFNANAYLMAFSEAGEKSVGQIMVFIIIDFNE